MSGSFLCAVLLAASEPSCFVVEVDAHPGSHYTVSLDGRALVPGRTYSTQPLAGPVTIEVVVSWIDGDDVRTQTFRVVLIPGMTHTLRLTLPRVFPTEGMC